MQIKALFNDLKGVVSQISSGPSLRTSFYFFVVTINCSPLLLRIFCVRPLTVSVSVSPASIVFIEFAIADLMMGVVNTICVTIKSTAPRLYVPKRIITFHCLACIQFIIHLLLSCLGADSVALDNMALNSNCIAL